jgi:hypothetical protein
VEEQRLSKEGAADRSPHAKEHYDPQEFDALVRG